MDEEFLSKVLRVIRGQSNWLKLTLTAVIVFLAVLLIVLSVSHKRQLASQLVALTEVKDNFILNDFAMLEQKDRYRKFMIRIFDVYGYQYDGQYTKALNGKQQADYIDMTFDLDNLLGFKHYQIPVIHLMETGFDPRGHNTTSGLDEKGMGQQVWETALYAQSLLYMLPANYQKALKIDIKTSDDLYDWQTSVKVTYILAWWHRRGFPVEEWWLSIYHWGGFLSRYWDDGKGRIPDHFTIGGIKYSVMEYFVAWQKLVDCFGRGEIEPGRPIVEKWQAYQKKLMKEEIQLRNARSIIRNLRSDLEEKNFYEQKLMQKYQEIDKTVSESLDALNRVYGVASKQNTGERIRAELLKAKAVVKDTISKLKGQTNE